MMDPSAWMDYTTAAAYRSQQMQRHQLQQQQHSNPSSQHKGSYQHHANNHYPTNGDKQANSAAFNNKELLNQMRAGYKQTAHQNGTGDASNHFNSQQMMNSHCASNGWLFPNPHQSQCSNHTNTSYESNMDSSAAGHFGHSNGYAPNSFMSPVFGGGQQHSKQSNAYLSHIKSAASNFIQQQMKKSDNSKNGIPPNGYDSTASRSKAICMPPNDSDSTAATVAAANSFFGSAAAAAAAWHQNLMHSSHPQDMMYPSGNQYNGKVPCNSIQNNGSLQRLSSACSTKYQHPAVHCPPAPAQAAYPQSESQYKKSSSMQMPLSSDSYSSLMSANRTRGPGPATAASNSSFAESAALGAKMAAAAQVAAAAAADSYTSFMLAQEYACMHQARKHHQYMSTMNGGYAGPSPEYVGGLGSAFPSNLNSANYCPPAIFPNVTQPTATGKSNGVNGASGSSTIGKSQSTSRSRRSASSHNKTAQSSKQASAAPYHPSDYPYPVNSSSFANGYMPGGGHVVGNSSRCSSVIPVNNHQSQQMLDNSYNYNYSPATTNISSHSPYLQRSSTSNSSHSSSASACGVVPTATPVAQDFITYPNSTGNCSSASSSSSSASSSCNILFSASQTPTPTPGYPTPPSSVGQNSLSRCNIDSNDDLSPYSNNSMCSSNMSQPPYNGTVGEYNKVSNAQISPQHLALDNSCNSTGSTSTLSDNSFQYTSSCMLASSQPKASPMYPHSSTPNMSQNGSNSYKSQSYSVQQQQQYPSVSQIQSGNGMDTMQPPHVNQETYTNYEVPNQDLIPTDDSTNNVTDYAYHYPHADSMDAFGHELSSTSTDASDSPASSSMGMEHLPDSHKDTYEATPNLHEEEFNLNFESVIQPIDVDQLASHSVAVSLGTSMVNMNEPIDSISFMSSQSQCDDLVSGEDTNEEQPYPDINSMNHCDSANFESSQMSDELIQPEAEVLVPEHQSEALVVNGTAFPETGSDANVAKSDHTNELLSNGDSFLPDLAPLLNDNSKIALMESTFKTNTNLPAIDHHKSIDISDAVTSVSPFEQQLNKGICFGESDFDKTLKLDDVESQMKDVDDFLESNFKEASISTEEAKDLQESSDIKKETVDLPAELVPHKANANKSTIAVTSKSSKQTTSSKFPSSKKSSNSREKSTSPVCSLKSSSPKVVDSLIRTENSKKVHEDFSKVSSKRAEKRKPTETVAPIKIVTDTSTNTEPSCNPDKKRKVVFSSPNQSKLCIKIEPEAAKRIINADVVLSSSSAKPKQEHFQSKLSTSSKPTEVSKSAAVSKSTSTSSVPKTIEQPILDKLTLTKQSVSIPPKRIRIRKKPSVVLSRPTIAPSVQPIQTTSTILFPMISKVARKRSRSTKPNIVSIAPAKPSINLLPSPPLMNIDSSPNSLSERKENVASVDTSAGNHVAPVKTSNKSTSLGPLSAVTSDVNKTPQAVTKTKAILPKTTSSSTSTSLTKLVPPVTIKVPPKRIRKRPTGMSKVVAPIMPANTVQPKLVPISKKPMINLSNVPVSTTQAVTITPTSVPSSAQPKNGTLLPSSNLISPKPSITTTNFNLASSANSSTTLSNVTPTLIVNQNASLQNSYQVSPMTNAVLISIHPANGSQMSSLTGPSTYFALSTQGVSSGTSGNTTTTTATSSSSSRRRSHDKKVATIREGLMRTGDFVVAEEESTMSMPVIWRIEGKSLLQRFEPSEQNGVMVYINTSSYSAWNPTVRQKYIGLDVRIMGCNRTRIVVEKIGLTQSKVNQESSSSTPSKENGTVKPETEKPANIEAHLESFEVLIQTLVSQALDSNFISEIVKENDEYFLSHIKIIDETCDTKRKQLSLKIKWESNMLKYIETFPVLTACEQENVGDLRCRLCLDNWSTKLLSFDGEPYSTETLELQKADLKPTKFATCDTCNEKIFLYSKLYHQKYNFFIDCKNKVESITTKDENKESPEILDECCQDTDWIKKMFTDLEKLFAAAENLR